MKKTSDFVGIDPRMRTFLIFKQSGDKENGLGLAIFEEKLLFGSIF